MCRLFRIYTSDVNRRAVLRLAADKFESFTLHPATGFYRGQPEESIMIELVQVCEQDVEDLAQSIRELNGQKSVLVMSLHADAQNVAR
jgi:hypothetical protein